VIIGLCGAAGAGKGSVANVLVTKYFFSEIAFADPLYQMISTVTGLTVEQLHDRAVKEAAIGWLGKSPRQLLQTLGTEWGRGMVADDLWVRLAMRRAREHGDTVITDVRFDNEAEAVLAGGGEVWQVARPTPSCLRQETASHSSEAGISQRFVGLTIQNSGTLKDLERAVDAAMRLATHRYNGDMAQHCA
jgi:hypothetical protein